MTATLTMYPAHFVVLFLRLWKYHSANQQPDELDENAKKHWRLWLLPGVVSCIDPMTHHELTADLRRKLFGHLQVYRTLAEQANTRPPTDEELRQARAALLDIYRLVPTFMTSWLPEKEVLPAIDRVLSQPMSEKWVVGYDFKAGDDWTGDKALWVWVIVEDARVKDPSWQAEWEGIQNELAMEIDRVKDGRLLLYSLLRTVSEQQELVAGVWE